MYEQINRAVTRRYRAENPGMNSADFEILVRDKVLELAQEATVAMLQAHLKTLQEWRAANFGREPDCQTQVGMNRNAEQIGFDLALSLLWEDYQDKDIDDWEGTLSSDAIERASWEQLPAVHRWQTEYSVPADDEIRALAERLWPEKEPKFVVWAEALLAALSHDQLPIPAEPGEPLAEQLALVVLAAIDQHDAAVAAALRK